MLISDDDTFQNPRPRTWKTFITKGIIFTVKAKDLTISRHQGLGRHCILTDTDSTFRRLLRRFPVDK